MAEWGGRGDSHNTSLCYLLPPVPPAFRQAPSGPHGAVLVRVGDRAVLSCETDALPEPTVTWYKDGQPLILAQQTQALQGGQRLEIQEAQVSNLWGTGSHGQLQESRLPALASCEEEVMCVAASLACGTPNRVD